MGVTVDLRLMVPEYRKKTLGNREVLWGTSNFPEKQQKNFPEGAEFPVGFPEKGGVRGLGAMAAADVGQGFEPMPGQGVSDSWVEQKRNVKRIFNLMMEAVNTDGHAC